MSSYIRGPYARAACSLIDHLRPLGVLGPVGYDTGRGRERKLTVYYEGGDRAAIPSEWQGFAVVVRDSLPATGAGAAGIAAGGAKAKEGGE
jgi:hypothetical protein